MSETKAQTIPEQTPYKEVLPPGAATETVNELLTKGLPDSDKDLTIEELLEKRGPQIMEGLGFEVNNGEATYSFATPVGIAGSKRYVIREGVSLKGQKKQPKRTILPSSPKTIEDRIPFIYTTGGIFQFGRRIEDKPVPVSMASFVIDKYNADGKLEDILVYDQETLLKFMNTAAIAEVTPPEKARKTEPAHEARRAELQANPHGQETFNEITGQLEAQNIYNWTGLSWQEIPGKADTDKPKAVVKVLLDTTLAEKIGEETTPIRTLLVRETVYGEIITQVQKVIKGAAIRPYLEKYRKGKDQAALQNMRLIQRAVPVPALEANIDEQEMEERTRSNLEKFIHPQMSEHADKDTDEKLALWLLSYSDVEDPEGEGARQERFARLHQVEKAPEGDRRIATVKELLDTYGTARVYALASKLRNDFLSEADSLNLPTEFTDVRETRETAAQSISWVLEDLAHLYYFAKHPDKTDDEHAGLEMSNPFDTTVAAGRQQRNIVARQLASSLMSESVDRKVVPKPNIKDNKIVQEPDEVFIFNPDSFRKMPSLTKDAAIAIQDKIYESVASKRTVLWSDLVKLGNELQRGIGQ